MPKQKLTKEIILEAALALLREEGQEHVNARSVAKRIGCSVQPIYSYFVNMDALMNDLYSKARRYLNDYVDVHADRAQYFGSMGSCHISFAREESRLFRFLFLSPYQRAKGFADVYQKNSRVDATQDIQETFGLSQEHAEELYMHMMLYTHGIACILATGAADIPAEEVLPKVNFACLAFYSQLGKEITCN